MICLRLSVTSFLLMIVICPNTLFGQIDTCSALRYKNSPSFQGNCGQALSNIPWANTIVSTFTDNQAEPTIAVSPLNSNHRIAAWIDERNNETHIRLARFIYTSNTWQDVGRIPDLGPSNAYTTSADPSLAADIDDENVFYLAFISYLDENNGGVWVIKTTDGGQTWPTNLFHRLDNNAVFEDKPWIIIDRTNTSSRGYAYVSWSQPSGTGISSSMSTDQGNSWSSSTYVGGGSNYNYAFPAIRPDGALFVAYANNNLGLFDAEFYITKSIDHGQTFSTPKLITHVDTWKAGAGVPGFGDIPVLPLENG